MKPKWDMCQNPEWKKKKNIKNTVMYSMVHDKSAWNPDYVQRVTKVKWIDKALRKNYSIFYFCYKS